MIRALKDNQLDIGVLLTEGAIKAVADGANFKIIQIYVNTPLSWGIYCGFDASWENIQEISQPSFCISRYGSGSHLMSYLLCRQQSWDMNQVEFLEIGNFSGALREFNIQPNRLFLWEKYMTKPYVDSGSLRKLGEIPTPWSSFCIAVRNDVLSSQDEVLIDILHMISDYTYKFKQNALESIDYISSYLDLSIADMKQWILDTDWNYMLDRPFPKLNIALLALKELKLISEDIELEDLAPDENFWKKCSL